MTDPGLILGRLAAYSAVVAASTFTGGMRGPGGANAAWPSARLTIASDGAITLGIRALPWFPPRRVRYQPGGILRAEPVRSGFLGVPGVRLVRADRPEVSLAGVNRSVVFWTWSVERVLQTLRDVGVPVASTSGAPPRVWWLP